MFIDAELVMSDAQVVTANAASTDYIDLGKAGDVMPAGVVPQVQFLVDTLANSANNTATVTFSVETSAYSAFNSKTTLLASGAVAVGLLAAKYVPLQAVLPVGVLQYIRGYYTIGTESLALGKFDCRIILSGDKTLDKVL